MLLNHMNIQDLKHYLHMGQFKAGLTCILSTLSIQETSEPLGLKLLRVLGQMTP